MEEILSYINLFLSRLLSIFIKMPILSSSVIITVFYIWIKYKKGKKLKEEITNIIKNELQSKEEEIIGAYIDEGAPSNIRAFIEKDKLILKLKGSFEKITDVSNNLIQLGLLFTFLGLTVMIIQILLQSNESNFNIQNILSGGLAFITSLFGLGFSMRLRKGMTDYYHKFLEFEKNLIFDLTRILDEQKNNVTNSFISEAISKAMSDNYTKPIWGLIAAVKKYTDTLDKHTKKMPEELNKGISGFKEEIKNMTNEYFSEFKKEISEVTNILQGYNESIQTSANKIENSFERILQSLKDNLKNIKTFNNEFIDSQRKLNELLEPFSNQLMEMTESLSNLNNVISKQIEDWSEGLKKYISLLDDMSKTNDVVNNYSTSLKEAIEGITRQLEPITKSNEEIIKSAKTIISQSEQQIKETSEILGKFENLPKDIGANIGQELTKEFEKSLKKFSENLLKLNDILNAMKISLISKLDEISKQFNYFDITTPRRDLIAEIEKALDSFANKTNLPEVLNIALNKFKNENNNYNAIETNETEINGKQFD